MAGYTPQEMKAAGCATRLGVYTGAEAKAAGHSLKEMNAAGYSCAEAKALGYTPQECCAAGFSLEEGKAAGYGVLRIAFTASNYQEAWQHGTHNGKPYPHGDDFTRW